MNCPKCDRVIYSRRHGVCGYCGEKLPEEMLLSPEEIAAMDAEKKAIQERLDRAEEEAKAEGQKRGNRTRRGLLGW